MKSKQRYDFDFQLIPKNDEKCVWMEFGIVSYKICNRNFECDACPLDQGLRGEGEENVMNHAKRGNQQVADSKNKQKSFSQNGGSLLERLVKFKLEKNYYVHSGHTWINVLRPKRVKIGIDDLVATALGSIDDVILPLPGEKIKRNTCCGQIIQFEHIFSIVSPVSGRVVIVNKELANFPNKLMLDPLKQGWMIVIKPENLEQDLKYCRSGDALLSWYLKEFKWFECNLAMGLTQKWDTIGLTLNDGGEISRNLRNYLPEDRYRRLVLSLLGVPGSEK